MKADGEDGEEDGDKDGDEGHMDRNAFRVSSHFLWCVCCLSVLLETWALEPVCSVKMLSSLTASFRGRWWRGLSCCPRFSI